MTKIKPKIKEPKIHPRGSWVLVKPVDPATQNEYGLTIPESVEKEQKAQGVVVDVGPDVEGLDKGMTVLYGKFAGEEIQLASKQHQKDRVDYVLLMNEDILATIEL